MAAALAAVTLLTLVTGLTRRHGRACGRDLASRVLPLARFLFQPVFELGPRAATPGKRLLGIRVAARDGGRLKAEAVFARNAMREVEVFLPIGFLVAQGVDRVDGVIILLGFAWSAIFAFFPIVQ